VEARPGSDEGVEVNVNGPGYGSGRSDARGIFSIDAFRKAGTRSTHTRRVRGFPFEKIDVKKRQNTGIGMFKMKLRSAQFNLYSRTGHSRPRACLRQYGLPRPESLGALYPFDLAGEFSPAGGPMSIRSWQDRRLPDRTAYVKDFEITYPRPLSNCTIGNLSSTRSGRPMCWSRGRNVCRNSG